MRCVKLYEKVQRNTTLVHVNKDRLAKPHLIANWFRRLTAHEELQGSQLARILGFTQELDQNRFEINRELTGEEK